MFVGYNQLAGQILMLSIASLLLAVGIALCMCFKKSGQVIDETINSQSSKKDEAISLDDSSNESTQSTITYVRDAP
jgi:hypothetical protein